MTLKDQLMQREIVCLTDNCVAENQDYDSLTCSEQQLASLPTSRRLPSVLTGYAFACPRWHHPIIWPVVLLALLHEAAQHVVSITFV